MLQLLLLGLAQARLAEWPLPTPQSSSYWQRRWPWRASCLALNDNLLPHAALTYPNPECRCESNSWSGPVKRRKRKKKKKQSVRHCWDYCINQLTAGLRIRMTAIKRRNSLVFVATNEKRNWDGAMENRKIPAGGMYCTLLYPVTATSRIIDTVADTSR